MPLYIRDDSVDDLANQVMRLTGAKNKTEAVRSALIAQIKMKKAATPLLDKVKEAQRVADKIGPVNPDFDMKAYLDEMEDNGCS